ncbi:adenosylcobinamide hydrolase [Geoglobus ahangari]|uniref:Adenosylcobinamide hydrolase n=1 Tax=Geoglobus ahangari TaxID=113653 RepID=A0A0F7IEZ5_9EURY|nr:adenosylcobinamide amidohydrolase [Geoglobus ahangari]AKG90993.1 adenosylcobinamide hydrolase [Geoglobus ahangari]
MEYRIIRDALVVEGEFNALSSGLLGGWRDVKAIFNHTVSDDFERYDPVEYLRGVASELGFRDDEYFGLLTSVPMDKLAVVSADEVTAFITAGVKNPNEPLKTPGTINIILVIDADVSDGGMVNAVITATEAKSAALFELGHRFTGTNTDAIVVARTGKGRKYKYSGPASELGRKIWRAVKNGVKESLGKW